MGPRISSSRAESFLPFVLNSDIGISFQRRVNLLGGWFLLRAMAIFLHYRPGRRGCQGEGSRKSNFDGDLGGARSGIVDLGQGNLTWDYLKFLLWELRRLRFSFHISEVCSTPPERARERGAGGAVFPGKRGWEIVTFCNIL